MRVKDCSEELVKKALQLDSRDNISVVVIALRWNIDDSTRGFLNDITFDTNISEELQLFHDSAVKNLISPRNSNVPATKSPSQDSAEIVEIKIRSGSPRDSPDYGKRTRKRKNKN